jgi:hypothetical protein
MFMQDISLALLAFCFQNYNKKVTKTSSPQATAKEHCNFTNKNPYRKSNFQ